MALPPGKASQGQLYEAYVPHLPHRAQGISFPLLLALSYVQTEVSASFLL